MGRSARGEELAQGFDEKGYRRTMMELLGTEAGPALRSQRTLLEGVYRRAAALNGLKKQGVLDAELESTLAWQLGLEGRTQAAVEADAEPGAEFDAGNAETQLSEPTFSVIPGDPRGPRQDKPSSLDDVKPRHLWASAKQYLPKLDDPRPAFGIKRGTWDHLVRSLANWLRIMPPVKDPWGTSVKLDNPQERGGFQDPMENRAAHLLGADTNKGTESRVLDQEKLDWVGAVRKTISDAQVRVRAGAETLYFRSYKDGVHMVVTADGAVQEQRVLITQYAPELSKGKFQGAVVEKTRNPRLAPQGSPGAVGIRAQPQPQTVQTPQPGTQGDLTSEESVGQESMSVVLSPGEGAAPEVSEDSSVQPRLSFSQGSGGHRLVDRFMKLAALEGRFRRGSKTDAKGLEEVLAHYSLKPGEARLDKAVRVRPGVSKAHTIVLASGGEAVLNVEGNKVWVDTQGVQGKAATGEGNNQEQELKGGDLVYQAAMTYALNNGLQFSPDPRSVTKKALRRRVSHMLSSALRHGTTKHLSPVSPAYSATTPDKVTKDLVADQWREEQTPEDYQHNLELLIREELKWVGEQMAAVPSLREARQKKAEKDAKRNGETLPPWPEPPPLVLLEDLQYDPASDTVLQRKKGADGTVQWQRLSEGDFRALVAGLDPGDSGVSAATLSRALVAKSEVEGHEAGRSGSEHLADQERNGGGVVSDRGGAKLFRLLGPDAAPNKLFYSQQQGNNLEDSAPGAHLVQRTGVTQAEVDEALERLRTLPEAAGLVDSLLIVGNRQELDGKDGRPGEADYQPDEWAGIETAEGFIDTKTGGAVVLRDQVEVREGETPAMAVARVVMHERAGRRGQCFRERSYGWSGEWGERDSFRWSPVVLQSDRKHRGGRVCLHRKRGSSVEG